MSWGNIACCSTATRYAFRPCIGHRHAYRDSLDHLQASREDATMRKLFLVLLLACGACSTHARDPGPSTPGAPAQENATEAAVGTLERMRALAGAASCAESSQCRTLPVGAMACGGPESYLPYSVSGTDEKALRALGEQYKAERKAANTAGGMMSICRHQIDPGAVCVSGTCQLGTPAGPVAPVAR